MAEAIAPADRPAGGGNEFYGARYDVVSAPPVGSRYIFFSSQRTGSNYLCRRLCNVSGRFGLPSEYLNPQAVKTVLSRLGPVAGGGARAVTLDDYLRRVEGVRTTSDGTFGIKVQPNHLLPRLPNAEGSVVRFLQGFERIIVLTRRDKLAQAVSGSIAEATGKWFADGERPALQEADLKRLCPDVALKLNRYIQEELMMKRAAAATGRAILQVSYEEILTVPDETFNRVLVFLGEPRGTTGVEEGKAVLVPKKPPGDTAQQLTGLFLSFIRGTQRESQA